VTLSHQDLRTGAVVLGGAHCSLAIARSLGRHGIPVWILANGNLLATVSRYAARGVTWPGPTWDGAVAFLTDLATRHRLCGWLLFAGGDAEVRFIAQNHAALATTFRLTTPAWGVTRWALDKRAMNARAHELDLAYPASRYPRSRSELTDTGLRLPVVVKPTIRTATFHPKAWCANDELALADAYEKAAAAVGADCVMVQELIPGDGSAQFSYAAIWHNGEPVGALTAQRRRQFPVDFGFTSTFVRTVEQNEVERAACRFLTSLNYSGLVEIEFKYDRRDGCYKMLDVNARAWSWIALGAAAGLDFPLMQWRLARGEIVPSATPRRGVAWRYLSRDIIAAGQELLAGVLPPSECARSFRPAAASAVFATDDPLPALLDIPLTVSRLMRRRFGKTDGEVASVLQRSNVPH